jgi:integrase
MTRRGIHIHKLSDRQIEKLKILPPRSKGLPKRGPKLVGDGGKLYVQVTPTGSTSWIFRWLDPAGIERRKGLGALHSVTAATARAKAADMRERLKRGERPYIDPTDVRPTITFAAAFERYLEVLRPTWRSGESEVQWQQSIAKYVLPAIGTLTMRQIERPEILKVLEPIWYRVPTTADRVRGRIEGVRNWARAHGYCEGDNPAAWDNLQHMLPSMRLLRGQKRPQPALPYQQLPQFMQALAAFDSIPAIALHFAIATACRGGDLYGGDATNPSPMLWSHVDLDEAVWVVPRGKNGQRHLIPLTPLALSLLQQLQRDRDPASDIVFRGRGREPIMSERAMRAVIERLNRNRKKQGLPLFVDPEQDDAPIVVHGFRASFKTWASEETGVAREVVEQCLSHAIRDEGEAERAYRRGSFFAKRRALMDAWADFLKGNVASRTDLKVA